MKRNLATMVFTMVLAGTASSALAGAYGETLEPEEGPVPVAAAPMVVEDEPPVGYWYLGAGALFSIENFRCDADNAWGYNIRGGRRINEMFAVEAEWEHPVDKFDDANVVDGFGRLNGDFDVWNITANGKFYPIQGRFQPYALVGAGYGQADLPHDDNGGFVARFGIGLDVLIMDNFGISSEVGYVLGTGALSDYDQIPISLGLFYNFI
ncbi:MAG: outer membrane beta-barrel protein [Candidatus Binatia bacterium]